MTIANTFPLDRPFKVSQQVSGLTALLGNVSDAGQPGFISVQIFPSADFEGSFQVLGRSMCNTSDLPQTPDAPFLQVPYRRVYTDGVVQDYGLVSTTIRGQALIHIPTNGIQTALFVVCTAGTCWVYPERCVNFGGEPASQITFGTGTGFAGRVGADSFSVAATLTRVADTNALAVGDVIAQSTTAANTFFMELPVAATAGQRVRVDKLSLATSQAACVAQIRAHFWNVPRATLPVGTPADNAAMTTILTNQPYYVGYIDVPALSAEAGTNTAARSLPITPWMEFQCAEPLTSVFVSLSTNTAFTPDSAQTFTLFVGGVRL